MIWDQDGPLNDLSSGLNFIDNPRYKEPVITCFGVLPGDNPPSRSSLLWRYRNVATLFWSDCRKAVYRDCYRL